jgi:hypothetical protein
MVAVPGVVVTFFALWSYVTFGDIRSGWFRLGGYSLIAEQYQIDLGMVTAGESKPGTFRLRNLTGKGYRHSVYEYILNKLKRCILHHVSGLSMKEQTKGIFSHERDY